jgi:hypothetical protein
MFSIEDFSNETEIADVLIEKNDTVVHAVFDGGTNTVTAFYASETQAIDHCSRSGIGTQVIIFFRGELFVVSGGESVYMSKAASSEPIATRDHMPFVEWRENVPFAV